VIAIIAVVVVPSVAQPISARVPSAKRWDPRVVRFVRFVEKERGLKFDHPIPIKFLSERAFRKAVRDDDEVTAGDRRDAGVEAARLHALGLAAAGVDLIDAESDDAEGTVSGFYDQYETRMVIRGKKLDNTDVRVTVVHELTHALQDQRFDFDKIERDINTTAEDVAYTSILEGDAILVEDAYIGTLSKAEQDAYYADIPETVEPPTTVPAILDAELSAPYVVGPAFVDFLAARGEKARNRAIAHPPPSDEQVVDPVAYLEHQRPRRVAAPHLKDGEQRRGTPGQVGAVGLYLVLAARLDPETALRAATGWAGDRYRGFTHFSRDCVRFTIVGDTRRDTDELRTAFVQWGSRGSEGTVSVEPTAKRAISVRSCADDAATPPSYDTLNNALELLGERIYFYSAVAVPGVDPRDSRCLADHFATDPKIVELSYDDDVSAADEQYIADRTTTYARQCGITPPG
jgi:hypothetical protein